MTENKNEKAAVGLEYQPPLRELQFCMFKLRVVLSWLGPALHWKFSTCLVDQA